MRDGSDALQDVLLSGSFDTEWVADLYYDNARRISNLHLVDVGLDDDGTALVQGTGSTTVLWTPDFAESMTPQAAGDTFAPFGPELSVGVIIRAGTFEERVQMGWYRIENVPSAEDQFADFGGQLIPIGSRLQFDLQDRMRRVQKDRFDVPGSPPARGSVLNEARRITDLQIVREVPDAQIPKSFAYEEERLDPLYDLLEFADAVPYMRPDGSLGQRPIAWPDPVDVLHDGAYGTLVSVGYAMSADKVYNRVVVRSAASGDDGQRVLAVAQITDGPLRVRNADGSPSPYGRVTYYLSSDKVTTTAQAKAWADSTLPQVSSLRVAERPIVEVFNPLRQVGDVLLVQQRGRDDFVGRVSKISRKADQGNQQITVEVQ